MVTHPDINPVQQGLTSVNRLFRCLPLVIAVLLALETTTNNQEVKRSLYRLQNVNNLPKDYIRTFLTCRSLAELFKFIGLVQLQEYIYSVLKIWMTIVD